MQYNGAKLLQLDKFISAFMIELNISAVMGVFCSWVFFFFPLLYLSGFKNVCTNVNQSSLFPNPTYKQGLYTAHILQRSARGL